MDLRNKAKKLFGKEHKQLECQEDPQTGKLNCRTFRKNPDGTIQELANASWEVGSDCSPVRTRAREHEEGELVELEQKVLPSLVGNCKRNTPADY